MAATKPLSDRARKAQIKIAESDDFKAWFESGPVQSIIDDHLYIPGGVETLGSNPPQEQKYDYEYGRGYHMVDVPPARWDDHRTKLVQMFQIAQRNTHNNPKQLSLNQMKKAAKGGPQFTGDDPRLAQFWEDAGVLAKSMGFCFEYGRLAALLGGPKVDCD